jgi:hypothetical protein
MIDDSGDEVDAQAEAFSSVAITFGKQSENLQAPDRVFHSDSVGIEASVKTFIFFAEWLFLTALDRLEAIVTEFLNPLVATIAQ